MNFHPHQLLQHGRLKSEQYRREAAEYSRLPKGRLRHQIASLLRSVAARLEPETSPNLASFERTV